MQKKFTTAEWVEAARTKHGDRYDYSRSTYISSSVAVEIVCRIHGPFWQRPMDHLKPCNCPACAKESNIAARTSNTEAFITQAKKVHGDVYDYSQTVYTKAQAYCTIICKIHGPFKTKPCWHLAGSGCKHCGIESRAHISASKAGFVMGNAEMDQKAKQIHGPHIHILSKQCNRSSDVIDALCAIHGRFTRPAREVFHDTQGSGCPQCGNERGSAKRRTTVTEFIEAASKKHNNKYDYSSVSFKRVNEDVTIICPEHGPYVTNAEQHMYGKGVCQVCVFQARLKTADQFLLDAQSVHGNTYDYSLTKYTKAHEEVTIVCPSHGPYTTKAYVHLTGNGKCPSCGDGGTSNMEKELGKELRNLGLELIVRSKRIIPPQEIDFYFPGLKVGVELCGLYWHSEKFLPASYHANKLLAAENNNIRLIQIYEDEFLHRRPVVLQTLKRILRSAELKSVGARQCKVVTIEAEEAKGFFNSHHLSGHTAASEYLGLAYNGELCAAASFSAKRSFYGGALNPRQVELVRFCPHSKMVVHGGLAKLTNYYLEGHDTIDSIISYVDRRWFTGDSYRQAAYTQAAITKPGYFYARGQKRLSRYTFAKHRLPKILPNYDPRLTEHENMLKHNLFRIYDCGHYKFIRKK